MMLRQLSLVLLVASTLAIFQTTTDSGASSKHSKDEQIAHEFGECIAECLEGCSPKSKQTDLGLNCFQPCYSMCSSRHNIADDGLQTTANSLKSVPANFCTDGLDPKKDDLQKVLEAFAKGPCSPIMIAPGFLSTKLMVDIDCETFRQENPERFAYCGWNACTKSPYEFWKSVPEKEYNLWIPTLTSPLSLFTYSFAKNLCFVNVFELIVDLSKPFDQMLKPRPGVKIRTFGFTDQTRDSNNCGSGAISNLMASTLQAGPLKAFNDMIKFLEHAGYVSGLTLQSMPYNFLLSYRYNEFKMNFKPTLQRMKKLTGKKTTIVAHSMGNLNTLYNLGLMTKEEKQDLVFNWISVAPPFLGAYFSIKSLVAGMDDIQIFSGRFGLHLKAASYITRYNLAVYELIGNDPATIYKGQEWLKSVEQRIKYEKDFTNIPYSESGLTFWPPASDICYDNSLTFHKLPNCLIRLNPQNDEVIIKITKDEFSIDSFTELLKAYALEDNMLDLFTKFRADDLYNIVPEVPVVLVYTSAIPTPQRYEFDDSMKKSIQDDLYPQESFREDMPGDEKVPVFSGLYPGLKWALEHQSKPDPKVNYQPVKFLEFCSIGHTTESIYDGKDEKGTYKITDSKYHGMLCSCNGYGLSSYANCKHSNMISDPFLFNLIIQVAEANQVPDPASLEHISSLKHDDILKDITECKHIKPSIFD